MKEKIKFKVVYTKVNPEIVKPERYINFIQHLVNIAKENEQIVKQKTMPVLHQYNK